MVNEGAAKNTHRDETQIWNCYHYLSDLETRNFTPLLNPATPENRRIATTPPRSAQKCCKIVYFSVAPERTPGGINGAGRHNNAISQPTKKHTHTHAFLTYGAIII